MRARDFFASNPVFRVEEFHAARAHGEQSRQTGRNLLRYHVEKGHILSIRRGLYATPTGAADPYLLASKIASDAVLAYHAALQFRGCAYSVWRRYPVLTRGRERRLAFDGLEFLPVQAAPRLREREDLGGFIRAELHRDVTTTIRVTSLERTLVDVFDVPRLGGGWEEIWRSLDMVEFFDLEAIIQYALVLGVALTTARVGYYLERNRERLMVEERHLDRLEQHRPRQPRYFDGRQRGGALAPRWNLYIPPEISDAVWEEPG